jgi:hypothetical protein
MNFFIIKMITPRDERKMRRFFKNHETYRDFQFHIFKNCDDTRGCRFVCTVAKKEEFNRMLGIFDLYFYNNFTLIVIFRFCPKFESVRSYICLNINILESIFGREVAIGGVYKNREGKLLMTYNFICMGCGVNCSRMCEPEAYLCISCQKKNNCLKNIIKDCSLLEADHIQIVVMYL